MDTQPLCKNVFKHRLPIVQSEARRVSIRNSTHGSIISGTQDVTNGGEPMSLTDGLVKPLRQAPVLGKDSGERTLPRDWNNSRNERQGMEVGKRLVFSSGWLKAEERKYGV